MMDTLAKAFDVYMNTSEIYSALEEEVEAAIKNRDNALMNISSALAVLRTYAKNRRYIPYKGKLFHIFLDEDDVCIVKEVNIRG